MKHSSNGNTNLYPVNVAVGNRDCNWTRFADTWTHTSITCVTPPGMWVNGTVVVSVAGLASNTGTHDCIHDVRLIVVQTASGHWHILAVDNTHSHSHCSSCQWNWNTQIGARFISTVFDDVT